MYILHASADTLPPPGPKSHSGSSCLTLINVKMSIKDDDHYTHWFFLPLRACHLSMSMSHFQRKELWDGTSDGHPESIGSSVVRSPIRRRFSVLSVIGALTFLRHFLVKTVSTLLDMVRAPESSASSNHKVPSISKTLGFTSLCTHLFCYCLLQSLKVF